MHRDLRGRTDDLDRLRGRELRWRLPPASHGNHYHHRHSRHSAALYNCDTNGELMPFADVLISLSLPRFRRSAPAFGRVPEGPDLRNISPAQAELDGHPGSHDRNLLRYQQSHI